MMHKEYLKGLRQFDKISLYRFTIFKVNLQR